MTGLNGHRVYLDWNATAPLRPEARAAMLEAMDLVGNPSSVHAEGRAAKAVIEKARAQVAALVGCEPGEMVFTSGATEANNWVFIDSSACLGRWGEHESSTSAAGEWGGIDYGVKTLPDGGVDRSCLAEIVGNAVGWVIDFASFETANAETGRIEDIASLFAELRAASVVCVGEKPENWDELERYGAKWRFWLHTDATQAAPRGAFSFRDTGADMASCSAHKLGGPKGVGALIVRKGLDKHPMFFGGGQEQGRRSGTENVIGIAGFGAAAEAAKRDIEAGVWDRMEKLRDALESKLAEAAPEIIIFGKDAPRLPNTSCFAIRGWAGETQVMQMDLAGFAVSAGSACSSGKVGPSRVILAMTGDEELARSAIRVSMGPTTTEAEVMAFADTWIEHYARRAKNAA